MKTVIGLNNLKDKFREAKLRCGDMRGFKSGNRFELTIKFNLPALQTFFFISGGNGDERMELTADCYEEGGSREIHAYTMGGLIEDMKGETCTYDVQLICLVWNKERNDAKRKTVLQFYYKNN